MIRSIVQCLIPIIMTHPNEKVLEKISILFNNSNSITMPFEIIDTRLPTYFST